MILENTYVFGFPNQMDSVYQNTSAGQYLPRIGGGSFELTRPLTNLIEPELFVNSRSTDLASDSLKICCDLGALRTINLFALTFGIGDVTVDATVLVKATNVQKWSGVTVNGTNAANSTTLEVTLNGATIEQNDLFTIVGDDCLYKVTNVSSSTLTIERDGVSGTGLCTTKLGSEALECRVGDFTSPQVETTALPVWDVIYKWGTLPYGHPSRRTGKPSTEDLETKNTSFYYLIDDPVAVRFVEFSLADAANDNGYVTIRRVVVSPIVVPIDSGASWGAAVGKKSNNIANESLGGVTTFWKQKNQTVMEFNSDELYVDEALSTYYDFLESADTDKQIFLIFDKSISEHKHRLAGLYRMSSISPLSFTAYNRVSTTHKLIEVIG